MYVFDSYAYTRQQFFNRMLPNNYLQVYNYLNLKKLNCKRVPASSAVQYYGHSLNPKARLFSLFFVTQNLMMVIVLRNKSMASEIWLIMSRAIVFEEQFGHLIYFVFVIILRDDVSQLSICMQVQVTYTKPIQMCTLPINYYDGSLRFLYVVRRI